MTVNQSLLRHKCWFILTFLTYMHLSLVFYVMYTFNIHQYQRNKCRTHNSVYIYHHTHRGSICLYWPHEKYSVVFVQNIVYATIFDKNIVYIQSDRTCLLPLRSSLAWVSLSIRVSQCIALQHYLKSWVRIKCTKLKLFELFATDLCKSQPKYWHHVT